MGSYSVSATFPPRLPLARVRGGCGHERELCGLQRTRTACISFVVQGAGKLERERGGWRGVRTVKLDIRVKLCWGSGRPGLDGSPSERPASVEEEVEGHADGPGVRGARIRLPVAC